MLVEMIYGEWRIEGNVSNIVVIIVLTDPNIILVLNP